MKQIISASRRSDLIAFFPDWLEQCLHWEKAVVYGPCRNQYTVDLSPERVHTLVLWSKDFSNLILDKNNLLQQMRKYDQMYLHFTITGLGGTLIEKNAPLPHEAFQQLNELIKITENPRRITVRFDPVVFWKKKKTRTSNLRFFEQLAPELSTRGITDIRISFVQWYGKSKARALKHEFAYLDPTEEEKIKAARYLVETAQKWGLNLYSCSQNFLTVLDGISPSSCINGPLLQRLHPGQEPVSVKKDNSQRKECRCTESVDIGSYLQSCPHACLYCYANPSLDDS
ncbi:MAG: DUF1848 family protein [Candidatus Aminicenantes bacterium]|nr:DUF1848 family protein [Candidatus Aminicenantes bacterium]